MRQQFDPSLLVDDLVRPEQRGHALLHVVLQKPVHYVLALAEGADQALGAVLNNVHVVAQGEKHELLQDAAFLRRDVLAGFSVLEGLQDRG